MNRFLADARVAIERCAKGQPFNLLPLEAQAVIDEMARLREKEFVFNELLAALENLLKETPRYYDRHHGAGCCSYCDFILPDHEEWCPVAEAQVIVDRVKEKE